MHTYKFLSGVLFDPAKEVTINITAIAATKSTGWSDLPSSEYSEIVPFAFALNCGSVSGLNAINNAGIVPTRDSDILQQLGEYCH